MNEPTTPGPASRFGPNAWLIEEKYQQFREFPESVGESWRGFFDHQQEIHGETGAATPAPPAPSAINGVIIPNKMWPHSPTGTR